MHARKIFHNHAGPHTTIGRGWGHLAHDSSDQGGDTSISLGPTVVFLVVPSRHQYLTGPNVLGHLGNVVVASHLGMIHLSHTGYMVIALNIDVGLSSWGS